MDCPMQVNTSLGPVQYHMLYQVEELRPLAMEILEAYACSECSPIKKIVYWVRKHMRYMTDYMQFGLSDYWELPTEILESGYGDCDGLSFLTASLLEACGVYTRCVMGNSRMGYHMWLECVDEDGEWLLIEATNGKIYPWIKRTEMGYYPDIYITPQGCSIPEDWIVTELEDYY